MADNKLKICYNLIGEVLINSAYSNIKLDEVLNTLPDSDKPYVTRVFYGVLENNVTFDYIIAKLTDKRPKKSVGILIKIGLYLLRFSDTPDYAAINNTVDLCKSVGKGAVSGFVNAVLKRSIDIKLPTKQEVGVAQYLSIQYSYPLELTEFLLKQYDADFLEQIFAYDNKLTFIRHNSRVIDADTFKNKLEKAAKWRKIGYYVTHSTIKRLKSNEYTIQSLASMLAVRAYLPDDKELKRYKVLDVCGAPAGKSIYMEELIDADFTVCDIHPHRVELINGYAKRMKSAIRGIVNDATVVNSKFLNAFDIVICDVPCSGLGVRKPDIILNRTVKDIFSLVELQTKILEVSSNYVKSGGLLNYSTCTITKQENDKIVNDFLLRHTEFEKVSVQDEYVQSDDSGFVHLYPHINDCDGFFVAKLKKKF